MNASENSEDNKITKSLQEILNLHIIGFKGDEEKDNISLILFRRWTRRSGRTTCDHLVNK